MARRFIAKQVRHPAPLRKTNAAEPERKAEPEKAKGADHQPRLAGALAGMKQAAADKTAARGGNKRAGHKVYPHLD